MSQFYDTATIWTLLSHALIYVMAIGLLIPAGLGISSCYFFLVPTCQISVPTFTIRFYMTHTIVDNDVESALIYRCNGKAGQPLVRPCENHDLCMKWEQRVNRSNIHSEKQFLHPDDWIQIPKSRECE